MTREVEREAQVVLVIPGPPHLAGEWWRVSAELAMENAKHRASRDAAWLRSAQEDAWGRERARRFAGTP